MTAVTPCAAQPPARSYISGNSLSFRFDRVKNFQQRHEAKLDAINAAAFQIAAYSLAVDVRYK